MKNSIYIGASRIEERDEACRMTAAVTVDGVVRELYFECDSIYKEYLVAERCDPFVLLLLAYAQFEGRDIVCESPITERLAYQLRTDELPALGKYISTFRSIGIMAELGSEIEPEVQGVCTGFSAGVDSWHTVIKHLDTEEPSYRLTHLMFNNVGALTKDYAKSLELFHEKGDWFAGVAAELGLPLVKVNTNIVEFLEGYPSFVTVPNIFKNAACVYALKRMFSVYLVSSTVELSQFAVDIYDLGACDPFNVHSLTVGHLAFYCSGLTSSRIDKVSEIADNTLVQKTLSVCSGKNCGHCRKCTRTMLELYALGKLDDFSKERNGTFDVDYFRKNLADRIAFVLADPDELKHDFTQESLRMARKKGKKIPLLAWPLSVLKWRPLLFFRRKLSSNRWIREIYERKNIRERWGL